MSARKAGEHAELSHPATHLHRQIRRAADAIDAYLLTAALDNSPEAEPFIRRRWERVRGVEPDDVE